MLIYIEDSNWIFMCLFWVIFILFKLVSFCGIGGVVGGLFGWFFLLLLDVF